jgi:hypothetical protein
MSGNAAQAIEDDDVSRPTAAPEDADVADPDRIFFQDASKIDEEQLTLAQAVAMCGEADGCRLATVIALHGGSWNMNEHTVSEYVQFAIRPSVTDWVASIPSTWGESARRRLVSALLSIAPTVEDDAITGTIADAIDAIEIQEREGGLGTAKDDDDEDDDDEDGDDEDGDDEDDDADDDDADDDDADDDDADDDDADDDEEEGAARDVHELRGRKRSRGCGVSEDAGDLLKSSMNALQLSGELERARDEIKWLEGRSAARVDALVEFLDKHIITPVNTRGEKLAAPSGLGQLFKSFCSDP